jgi:putative hydrolase
VEPTPFGDIPLFREIQRLLASSGTGPVNLEIAGQVAQSVATEGQAEGPILDARKRVLAEVVHTSETLLAGYTRLSLLEPIQSEAVTRSGWATKTLSAWRWLLERMASRFVDELGGDSADESEQQMAMVMKQVGPLLMGLQSGTLVGHLAREVISGFDPSIPRDGENAIVLVIPNIEKLAHDYELDVDTVIRWVALQDVARHIVVQGVSWVGPYRRNLMTALIDSIEIDTSEMQRRLVDLQSLGMEALQEGASIDSTLPLVPTTAHQQALNRMRAFVGLHEGYSARAAEAVAKRSFGEETKVAEVIARQRAASSDAKDLLENVLGFSLSRDLVSTGTTFCAAIEKLEGLTALNRVWEAPDNLPTYDELKDPFLWIDRVLKQEELT